MTNGRDSAQRRGHRERPDGGSLMLGWPVTNRCYEPSHKGAEQTDTQGVVTMAQINRVGHVVLGVRDPQRSIEFYTKVLGMELVNFLEEMQMAFFSFGERDHDLAVIKVPDDAPLGSAGLAHTAFEIEGGSEQLQELYHQLKAGGTEIEFTADHGVTKSVYFLDPDGNRLELFCQVLAGAEGKDYLHNISTMEQAMQPLDLEPVAG